MRMFNDIEQTRSLVFTAMDHNSRFGGKKYRPGAVERVIDRVARVPLVPETMFLDAIIEAMESEEISISFPWIGGRKLSSVVNR